MNYLQRRHRAHLTRYDIAKALGIDYWQYVEVEKGERHLEDKYLEKFVSATRNPEPLIKSRKIKLALFEKALKDGTLEKRVDNYDYTVCSLGKALGYSHSVGYAVFRGRKVSDEIKLRVFDFLNDPMNRAVGKNFEFARKKKKSKEKTEDDTEIETDNIPVEGQVSTWEENPADYFKDELDKEISFENENEDNIETFQLEENTTDLEKQINTYKAVIEEQTKEIETLRAVIRTFDKLVSKL